MSIINAIENNERILDYATGQELLKLAKEQKQSVEEYKRTLLRQIKTLAANERKKDKYKEVLDELTETFAYNTINPTAYNIYNRAIKLLKEES